MATEQGRDKNHVGDAQTSLPGGSSSPHPPSPSSSTGNPIPSQPPVKPGSLPARAEEEGSKVQDQIISYGLQLRYEREQRGWTQEEFANMFGVDISKVQSWETNRSAPDLSYRQKLAGLLGNDY
jgi:ribosome-binding protein aMBF1 (putative translation factor)